MKHGATDATVAAVQSLKEKLTEHMGREEEEIYPLLATVRKPKFNGVVSGDASQRRRGVELA